jgi:signal transduction histidine kinase
LRHEIALANTQWSSQEEIDREDVLARMKEFLQQASAIIRLGEAAIVYARIRVARPEETILNGRKVVTEVRQVISAFQPHKTGIIETLFEDEWQLSAFQTKLAPPLFIHGLSKLVDNAVRAARASLSIEPKVLLRVRLSKPFLLIDILNTGNPLDDDRFNKIRRGLLSGDVEHFRPGAELRPRLGLREAWRCFKELKVDLDIMQAEAPFVLAVTLKLRPQRS